MVEQKFKKINEFIFAPFDTFVYCNDDRLVFGELNKGELIKYLNREPISLDNRNIVIEWLCEACDDFKISKGVFVPPGRESSVVMAQVVNKETRNNEIEIKEDFSNILPNSLKFKNIYFYFYENGTGTCSAMVEIEKNEGITILELEEISEKLNKLYKEVFEDICFQLSKKYIDASRKFKISHLKLDFLPKIDQVDKYRYFIPWTHRVYHIDNDKNLQDMRNPGELFRTLITPTSVMDIKDFSIYDNRYIYFGWGHSLIFTYGDEDGYSQTSRPVYDYIRLVEIAQAKWEFLDVLTDVVNYSIITFQKHYKKMKLKRLQKSINRIRNFRNGVNRILADFRGIKITFDTEKRILLDELHERWLTNKILSNLEDNIDRIEELLDQLYQRQKEQREESLNTIALLFTIVGVIEVFGLIFSIIEPVYPINPVLEIVFLIIGTILVGLMITFYIKMATKG
ncbi:MAG: hypothetical protein GF329_19905 [Candidatus Lokiarchaeota archaeon]|nr:hypothetical protein [Candidatus Lokiarchaeota archaeon]